MGDDIELGFPVDADLVVLARLTAATLASRAGFDIEEIEDLRLAVDELCLSVIRGRTDGRAELRFSYEDGCIEVSCCHRARGSAGAGTDDDPGTGLSLLILDALVDEHGVHEGADRRLAWLRKRRTRRLD